jgi:lipopolysaccharide export system protein LptA
LNNQAIAASDQTVLGTDDPNQTKLESNGTAAKQKVNLKIENGQVEAEQIIYNNKTGIVNASGEVKITTTDGIIIRAEKLVYDFNTQDAQFSGGVELTQNDQMMTAREIHYQGKDGSVTASGGVKVVAGKVTYQTETIHYNLQTKTGFLGRVTATISAVERNYSVVGKSMETREGITTVKNAKITRCEKRHPEYFYLAKKMTYDGQRLRLTHIILYVKGIPLFYFPYLSLNVNNKNLPKIEPRYDPDDGLSIRYDYSVPAGKNIDWRFQGELQTHDYSNVSFGIASSKGNFSNYAVTYYNFEGYLGVRDQLTHETPLLRTVIDGYQDFSNAEGNELGFSVTRKYWPTPVGRWQLGVLGRRVSKLDGSGDEYGGIYGGYRLDYNPYPNWTLSLLRLYKIESKNYGDFMEDFNIGSNWMYDGGVPIDKRYSFGLTGTYNSDQSLWIHRVYEIRHETDCIRMSFGWDDAKDSWVSKIKIKF